MKIALCFYGLAESLNGRNFNSGPSAIVDFRIGYYYNISNVITDNTDIFIHTWSVNSKNEIIQKYKPKKSIFEEQIKFDDDKRKNSCNSRWYSHNKVISLCKDYEKENDFNYDFIMITRFDIAFLTKINFNNLNPDFIYLSHSSDFINKDKKMESYEPDCIPICNDCHVANHNAINMNRFSDTYFIGGSAIVNLFFNVTNILHSNHVTIAKHFREKKFIDKVHFYLHNGLDWVFTRRKFLKNYVEDKFENDSKFIQYDYSINLYDTKYFELIFKIINDLNINISYDKNYITFEEFINHEIEDNNYKITNNGKLKKVKEVIPYIIKNNLVSEIKCNNLLLQNCYNVIKFENYILIKKGV